MVHGREKKKKIRRLFQVVQHSQFIGVPKREQSKVRAGNSQGSSTGNFPRIEGHKF